ncbi:hypothetical protein QFC19_008483 [Naganishia cerealis]|uniref:Uncharacterized protein n=1 Tax=Naganishia cerealis TaxID=610337 RepID=A0ACC2V205_9TREE|nr:hypothetical protein QFC19_008483 [Naganishia cerealis]
MMKIYNAVSDNLLVASVSPSHGYRCHIAQNPPVASLDLPTRKDLDSDVIVTETGNAAEYTSQAIPTSSPPTTPIAYAEFEKSSRHMPSSRGRISVFRNHLHWVLGMMLALFSFTMIEVSRSLRLGARFSIDPLLANYEVLSSLSDAVYALSWNGIATSLWLTMSCLDSALSEVTPEQESHSLFNIVAVEFVFTSSLAAAWIFCLIHYGRVLQVFWSSTTSDSRTEWMIYWVTYMSVCITCLLLLNATWMTQAAFAKAREDKTSIATVIFQQIDHLAENGEIQLLEDTEEGLIGYDGYLFLEKR